jgi:hypothetical protein
MLFSLCPSYGRNLGVNLAHGQLIRAFPFCSLAYKCEDFRLWSNRVYKILNAHNDSKRLSAAVNDEASAVATGAPYNLAELRPCGQC